MKNWLIATMILLGGCSRAREASAAPKTVPAPAEVAAGVKLTQVVKGLRQPVAMAYAPGDPRRLFVAEKKGFVRVLLVSSSGEVTISPDAPYLDVSKRVSNGSEQGLLGIAFHPKFAENKRYVVHFTDDEGDTRVVERKEGDAKYERELLFVKQPYSNHNGGHALFGPDGKLWIGLGDGGWANDPKGNGQNDKAQLGKMLVLDVDANGAKGKPEAVIWMKGLRNPWRYQFDRETKDLYIADVGQNLWEEIHVLAPAKQKGANLGWNVMEGNHCFRPKEGCKREGLDVPAMEYDHATGCSITGGFVYRGKAVPALTGHYFYSDHCTAIVRSFRWQGADKPVADAWEWRAALDPGEKTARISTFGEDEAGELYMVSQDGVIWRFDAKEVPPTF